MNRLVWILACALALTVLPVPASADLIPAPGFMVTGTGLGAVSTLVTISGSLLGDSTVESGCSVLDSSGGCFAFPEPNLGHNTGINQLVPLVDIVGASGNAGQLALVFNPNQTGNEIGQDSLTLLSLSVGIFQVSDGVTTMVDHFTYAPGGGIILKSAGVGSSGFYEFDLVHGQGSAYLASGDYWVGAAFSANRVNDGHETVYAINQGTQTPVPEPGPVPEPATMLLLGSGLVGLARLRRTQKASRP